jgi:glutaredoxin
MDAKLYHLEGCPYCRRVRDFIAHRRLEPFVACLEVSQDPDAFERLVQLTGRSQVPVLEVDGEPIVGSDVIIDWLDENALALSRRETGVPRTADRRSESRRSM